MEQNSNIKKKRIIQKKEQNYFHILLSKKLKEINQLKSLIKIQNHYFILIYIQNLYMILIHILIYTKALKIKIQ